MDTTEHTGPGLASHRTFRDRITIRSAPLTDRFGEIRRLEALQALFANAHRKPDILHELQRAEPRRRLPDEIQHALIHDGIRNGHITREQIVAYRASQLVDDLAAFPTARETDPATYCALMTEVAEAVDALTVARGLPTRENVDAASKETLEAAAIMQLHVGVQRHSA